MIGLAPTREETWERILWIERRMIQLDQEMRPLKQELALRMKQLRETEK